MNIKFTKKQLFSILEKYYREEYSFKGTVTEKHYKSQVGPPMCPYDDVIVEMKIKGDININGIIVPVEKIITEEDLQNAISYFLTDLGEIEEIKLAKGLTHNAVGYGMCETIEEKIYFNGVEVKLKNKTKKIGGINL